MSEKFALKWNDYQLNWNKSLSRLRNESEFADVTLISDDKVKFSAHKILLSSCSNMFKFILKENNIANPLLYLGGVSSVNLGFVLDYIYHGEVNLYQEQLDSFLESAQKLEIEGLIGMSEESMEQKTHHENKMEQDIPNATEAKQLANVDNSQEGVTRRQYQIPSNSDVARIDVTSLSTEDIEQKIKELYEKVDGVWTCLNCNYTSTRHFNLKKHVEKHIDGLSYSCNLCFQEFRKSDSLHKHKYIVHKTGSDYI